MYMCTLHARIRIALFAAISLVLIVPYFEDRSKHEFNRIPRFIIFRSNWISGGRKGETALKRTRERERARRRSETAEQREERLTKRRARDRARRAAQTAEERHFCSEDV